MKELTGMKTVILITSNPLHRRLYEPGLAKHFEVEYLPRIKGLPGRLDAVVYDIEDLHKSLDLKWLQSVNFPVVILSCESHLPLVKGRNRCVLTYPVRMDDILQALSRLGIQSRGAAAEEEAVG
jgi:hypothetical protein